VSYSRLLIYAGRNLTCGVYRYGRCGFDRLPAIASDGSSLRLRELRKLLNTEIGIKGSEKYKQIMEEEVCIYVKKLFEEPDKFIEHNQWFAVDIIMLISCMF
jgi:hypothetical protein